MVPRALFLFVLLTARKLAARGPPAPRSYSTHDYYVLELAPAASQSLEDCSLALQVEIVEQVGELQNHWLVRSPVQRTIERRRQSDPVLERYKALRTPLNTHSLESRSQHTRSLARSIRSVEKQVPRQRAKKRAPILENIRAPAPIPQSKSEKIAATLGIYDPIFNNQWHLANNLNPQYDLNVSGVWSQGITGKGTYVAVVDDGLDLNSDDLSANFYAKGSWDYNTHTALPLPLLSDDQHGTRCAGEIAAVKNDVCGVGVAYDSNIAGIRILSGPISDADEAAALNYGYNETQVYSCSWGPPDDGRSMEAPSLLIEKAVVNGIQKGRGGKGSIFVFASGNGAGSGDQCNFDGYTNSIYSVTVASVDHVGKHPYYSESCAANLIVAYSSGGGNRIYTTDVGKNKCTSAHGGTSAAAPLGAGVIALGLQARPELSWRDVQHICVRTAQHINPEDPDWEKTAVGRLYSYKYGFGALDAWTFVEMAKKWKLVKPQAWVNLPQVEINDANITEDGKMSGGTFILPEGVASSLRVTREMLKQNNFETLEHITVKVWISHAKRGDVEVSVTSPNGIKSILAGKRRFDEHKTGYPGWQFMSVKHWGENPLGDWKLMVNDQATPNVNGSFLGWSMTLWGESIDPKLAKLWTFPGEDGSKEPTVTSITMGPTSTAGSTTRPKPTDHLPDDHDVAHGDTTKPAFDDHGPSNGTASTASSSTPTASSTNLPITTPDEGYFSHMSDLLRNQTWLIIVAGIAVLFAVGGGIFFWRRRIARRKRSDYAAVGDAEGMSMGIVDGSSSRLLGGRSRNGEGRTKELYDAFGEPSDDEGSDADEGDRLVHRGIVAGTQLPDAELRYHDGFLEDDQPESTAVSPQVHYPEDGLPPREPETGRALQARSGEEGRSSPSGGSGDSWEHADPAR